MGRNRGRRPGTQPQAAWELLGLPPDSSAAEVIAARRALARRAHPDAGGSVERMQALNEAAEIALAALRDATTPRHEHAPSSVQRPRGGRPTSGGSVERDHPSFTIEALPAEAFEGLVVAATMLGRVVDDDPPYRLEVAIGEPRPAWCRLELVPDAGASTVSLTTARVPGRALPDIDEVRDRWIDALNRLDWLGLDPNRPPPW